MCCQAAFLVEFERQWRDYLQQVLRPEMHDQGLGREMTAGEVAALNDEQKVQLVRAIRCSHSSRPGDLRRAILHRASCRCRAMPYCSPLDARSSQLKIRENAVGPAKLDGGS